MRLFTACLAFAALLAVGPVRAETPEQLAQQVRDAENAFADTMARRDLASFAAHIADDAVFFSDTQALRGKEAVIAGWKPFYEAQKAPFSWKSQTVEVAASGQLAHSSGPVFDPQGRRVATFNSIWRRNPDGTWKVVFDKGCNVCDCAASGKT